MKLRYWFLLSLISSLTVGCIGQTVKNPSSENSATASPITSAPATQAAPLAQSTGQSKNSTKFITIKSGSFLSGEHPTQGTARIVTQDGKTFLELDQQFKTSDSGPDLVVILHRSNSVLSSTNPPAYPLNEGDYLFLAPLKKFSGAQQYEIPANINLADYQSAVIWCRRFNATFGTARLYAPLTTN